MSISKLSAQLAKLKSFNLDEVDENKIMEIFHEMPRQAIIGAKLRKGTQICRMRIIDILNDEKIPIKASELSYNPKSPNNYGRANLKNESMFYGSLSTNMIKDYMNIFFEVADLENKEIERLYFVISNWFVTEDMTRVEIGSTLKHAHNLVDRAKFIARYKGLDAKFKNDALELDEFLANEFSKKISKNNHYKISASYSKFLFNQGFDAIVYPSVATAGAGRPGEFLF